MKTILVVEDEFAIADMLHAVLEDEGYRVVLAGNGREGLARLADTRADLVICDVMMPVLDGREMLRLMKNDESMKTIPIIMMSAAESFSLNGDGRLVPFLNKPFTLDDLLEIVEAAIGKAEP